MKENIGIPVNSVNITYKISELLNIYYITYQLNNLGWVYWLYNIF